jgi:hypothetical protein
VTERSQPCMPWPNVSYTIQLWANQEPALTCPRDHSNLLWTAMPKSWKYTDWCPPHLEVPSTQGEDATPLTRIDLTNALYSDSTSCLTSLIVPSTQ